MIRGLALGALISLGALGASPALALASHDQVAMMEDLGVIGNSGPTLQAMTRLGVQQVKIALPWRQVAPQAGSFRRPRNFHAADPASYPDGAWAPWDHAIEAAQSDGLSVNLDVAGGEPLWAAGPGMPRDQPHPSWEPSPVQYGAFVHAVGVRYSGDYNPGTHRRDPGNRDDLPAVNFWSIWNEPDYGPSLAPQGVPGDLTIDHAPDMYRGLVDAAWRALHETGHGSDTILIGELAPRGQNGTGHLPWGLFSGMKPLFFLRSLYCVDGAYRPLRGGAARIRGCPATTVASRGFRRAHPGLFAAGGFAIHPYSRWHPPNIETPNDPDFASLADLGQLTGTLDRLQRVYGSHRQFPIWNTEYGYLTEPPKHTTHRIPVVSTSTASAYLNQAEYLSWRDPRIRSFMQYLLYDPPGRPSKANSYGGFASGLIAWNGRIKPTLPAWRLPLYLPATVTRRGSALEVWGCVRPAFFALQDVPSDSETVQIQLRRRGGSFSTIDTARITDPHGYFDIRVRFPSSGTIRLRWTYPVDDPSLPEGVSVVSRSVAVTVR